MSYTLTNLIKSLESHEIKAFKIYVSRYSYKNQEKKITLLFDAIKKDGIDEYSELILETVLPEGKKNALFQLKTRLIQAIESSLLHLHREKSEEFGVYRFLQLYQIFFHKSDYHKASIYLNKAEKTALKLENYESLTAIYRKHIQLARFLNISPDNYIRQQNKYQRLADATNQTEQYIAAIEYSLKNTNFSGKNNDILTMLEEISIRLEMDETGMYSPRTKLSVNRCVRQILLQKKEFSLLSNYMIESYEDFEKEDFFDKNNHEEKIIQLSWIINSLLKSKRIVSISSYTTILYEALEAYSRLFYDKYIWLYYQSKVMELTFFGKNMEAIDILVKLKEKETIQYNSTVFIFVYMNLIGLYFSARAFDDCLKHLAAVLLNPSFKAMSPDRKLNIQLLELIVRTEINDREYALLKCREIKRKYSEILKEETYQAESEFVKIVMFMLKKPDALKDKKFLVTAKRFIEHSQYEPGSNAFIDYAVWLRSKIEQKDYYRLIQEMF